MNVLVVNTPTSVPFATLEKNYEEDEGNAQKIASPPLNFGRVESII